MQHQVAGFVEEGEPELIVREMSETQEDHRPGGGKEAHNTACPALSRCSKDDDGDATRRAAADELGEGFLRVFFPSQLTESRKFSEEKLTVPRGASDRGRSELSVSNPCRNRPWLRLKRR
jgi:hypothetical protein